ncbi:MAG TPA: (d)CMP kinase [Hyphomicrobiaceae bacterium]|nr:(d)CMP kinase [Hyphomicrobiaceae bacterium]
MSSGPDKTGCVVIAIDGPAASGKGTVGRLVAQHYGLHYLDTGLIYRAVARDVLAAGGVLEIEGDAVNAARKLDAATLDDPALRNPGIGEAASIVAGIPAVRVVLLDFQRKFSRQPPGAVLDGRDIGTVVCPDAAVKVFVVADTEVRAERRFRELRERGESVRREAVLEMIRRRDDRDASRASAPMRPADDAILLDTTKLGIEAAFEAVIELIKRKIGQPGA